MTQSSHDQPDGDPTPAEIFRVFRSTTMGCVQGLRLLLKECVDLRGDLVTIHNLRSDGEGDGAFSARQHDRIAELYEASKEMEALIAALPREPTDEADGRAT